MDCKQVVGLLVQLSSVLFQFFHETSSALSEECAKTYNGDCLKACSAQQSLDNCQCDKGFYYSKDDAACKLCTLVTVNIFGAGDEFDTPMYYKKSDTMILEIQPIYRKDCITSRAMKGTFAARLIKDGDFYGKTEPLRRATSFRCVVRFSDYEFFNYGFYSIGFLVYADDDVPGSKRRSFVNYLILVETMLEPKIEGGTSRSLSVGQFGTDIVLNADPSYDPDKLLKNSQRIFSWYCRIGIHKSVDKATGKLSSCFKPGLAPTPGVKLRFHSTDLEYSSFPVAFTFLLELRATNRTSQTTTQTLQLNDDPIAAFELRCLLNCHVMFDPTRRAALRVECKNCATWYFSWSVSPPVPIIGPNLPVLQLPPDTFKNAKLNDVFIISVDAGPTSTKTAKLSYTLTINSSPALGTCSFTPKTGSAVTDKFNLTCKDFDDIHPPLRYKLELYTDNSMKELETILFDGMSPFVEDLTFPYISGGKLSMLLRVSDFYGAESLLPLDLSVKPAKKLGIWAYNNLMYDAQETNKNGDPIAAARMASVAVSSLNSMLAEGRVVAKDKELKKLRRQIVVQLAKISGTEKGVIDGNPAVFQQTMVALKALTSYRDQIDPRQILDKLDVNALIGSLEQNVNVYSDVMADSFLKTGFTAMLGATQNMLASARDSQSPKDPDLSATLMAAIHKMTGSLVKNTFLSNKPTNIETDGGLQVSLMTIQPKDLNVKQVGWQGVVGIEGNIPILDSQAETQVEVVTFAQNPFWFAKNADRINTGSVDIKLSIKSKGVGSSRLSDSQMIEFAFDTTTRAAPVGQELKAVVRANESALYPVDLGSENTYTRMKIKVSLRMSDPVNHDASSSPGKSSATKLDSPGKVLWRGVVIVSLVNDELQCFLNSSEHMDVWTKHFRDGENMTGETEVMVTPGQYPARMVAIRFYNNLNSSIHVEILLYQMSCSYWDPLKYDWSTKHCKINPSKLDELPGRLHCQCKHMSHFAGSSLFVPPNDLNIGKALLGFLNISDNPVGVALVCVLVCLLIILLLIARRADQVDRLRAMPVDLADNSVNARYVYVVSVYTGSRPYSGTSSDVYIRLNGEVGSSGSHRLVSYDVPTLGKGNADLLLLRTVVPLGKLFSIRLWHYNLGKHPSWFASRVVVEDIQARKKYYFICKRWMDLEAPPHTIDETVYVACTQDVLSVSNLFVINSLTGMKDSHLWFSVYGRPALSPFTRCQRLACCFTLLFGYLFTNIMFFNVEPEPERTAEMKCLDKAPGFNDYYSSQKSAFGPMEVKIRQIIIAIECVLIMMPVTLVVALLFRNVRRKPREQKILIDWLRLPVLGPKTRAPRTEVDESSPAYMNLRLPAFRSSMAKWKPPSLLKNINKNANKNEKLKTSDVPKKTKFAESADGKDSKNGSGTSGKSTIAHKSHPTVTEVNSEEFHSLVGDRRSDPDIDISLTPQSSLSDTVVTSYKPVTSSRAPARSNSEGARSNKDRGWPWGPTTRSEVAAARTNATKERPKSKVKSDTSVVSRYQSAFESDTEPDEKGLPWRCIYFAWAIVIIASLVFIFFTILYTFEYGYDKAMQWLMAVILTFLTGTFLQEPLKAMAITLLLVFLFKKSEEATVTQLDLIGAQSLSALEQATNNHRVAINDLRSHPHYTPPSASYIHLERLNTVWELKIRKVLSELLIYSGFILVLTVLLIVRTQSNFYWLNRSFSERLFNTEFHQMTSDGEFMLWVGGPLIDCFYHQVPVSAPNESRGNELSVRLHPVNITRYMFQSAVGDQALSRPDDNTLMLGESRSEAILISQRLYQSAWININVTKLEVTIATYTASVDAITYVHISFVRPSHDATFSTNTRTIHSIELVTYDSPIDIVVNIIEAIAVVYTMGVAMRLLAEVFRVGLREYLWSPWNWLEAGIICSALAAGILVVIYYTELAKAVYDLNTKKKFEFERIQELNFQLTAMLGLLGTFVIVRYIRILRFLKPVNRIIVAFELAAPYLLIFIIVSLLLIVMWSAGVYLFWHKHVRDFSTFLDSFLQTFAGVTRSFPLTDYLQLPTDLLAGAEIFCGGALLVSVTLLRGLAIGVLGDVWKVTRIHWRGDSSKFMRIIWKRFTRRCFFICCAPCPACWECATCRCRCGRNDESLTHADDDDDGATALPRRMTKAEERKLEMARHAVVDYNLEQAQRHSHIYKPRKADFNFY